MILKKLIKKIKQFHNNVFFGLTNHTWQLNKSKNVTTHTNSCAQRERQRQRERERKGERLDLIKLSVQLGFKWYCPVYCEGCATTCEGRSWCQCKVQWWHDTAGHCCLLGLCWHCQSAAGKWVSGSNLLGLLWYLHTQCVCILQLCVTPCQYVVCFW